MLRLQWKAADPHLAAGLSKGKHSRFGDDLAEDSGAGTERIVVLLDEALRPLQIVGALIVLGSIWLGQRAAR